MTRIRSRLRAALPLLLLAAVTAGCGDTVAGSRAASPEPKAYCPLPEEEGPTPSPCITFDWNERLAENHAYREPMPITAEQKEAAQPRAKALAAALEKLAGSATTEDEVRAAAADAIGVPLEQTEIRGHRFAPLRGVLVGGGEGRVCVNGSVNSAGRAEAEVIGRTADGTCLPGLGGH